MKLTVISELSNLTVFFYILLHFEFNIDYHIDIILKEKQNEKDSFMFNVMFRG